MDYGTVIVFAAHADDEITMAGTIAKFAASDVRVIVVQMTNGMEGYPQPEMRDSIVETRMAEAEACNNVLGIARRVMIGAPDMGLVNNKETLRECIKIIREERPDAAFNQGPDDRHRDHINTHCIARDALWHAGEPVSAVLGPSWKTPHIFLYKGVKRDLPSVEFDVSETAHKRYLALATQESQHTLFGRTREDFEAEAERIRTSTRRYTETFWLAPEMRLRSFPPRIS